MTARTAIPFVGEERQAEVEYLLGAFKRIRETNRPELLMLVGLPGWGKTRIIQEFYQRLAAERQTDPHYWPPHLVDQTVLAGRLDFETLSTQRRRIRHIAGFTAPPRAKVPWLWLAPTIRQAFGAGPALVVDDLYAELQTHMGPLLDRAKAVHESLGSLAELVTALLPMPDALSLISSGSNTVQSLKMLVQSQQKLQIGVGRSVDRMAGTKVRAEEVGRLLRQVARGGPGFQPLPIVLILDDAHGLDSVTTELIQGLIGSQLPVLVIATTWPDRFESGAPFCEFARTSTSTRVKVRMLSPLRAYDLSGLVLAAAPRTPPNVTMALVSRAGANPYALMLLLASEAVRMATVNGSIDLPPSEVMALGSSIEELLGEHWDRLSYESRVVLAAAALLGETVVRGPLANLVSQIIPGTVVDDHADPLWIRVLAESAELLGFLERVRYELALSKINRIWVGDNRSAILQKAADAVSAAVRGASGIERRVLLTLQYELSQKGAEVDPWERARGAIELARNARDQARNDEAVAFLAPVIDKLEAKDVSEVRVLVKCLNSLAASMRLSGASKKSTQSFAARAVELSQHWLEEDDDLRLQSFANKARSLRRSSAPEELNQAEQIAKYLRHKLDTLVTISDEVIRDIQGLEVSIEISKGHFGIAAVLAEYNVKFCEERFGPMAVMTTGSMGDLGFTLHRSNISRAIEVRTERMRRMAERLGDQNHHALAPAKNDLAISLLDRSGKGDSDKAIELIEQAIQAMSAVFGYQHIKTSNPRSAMIRARCHKALEFEHSGDTIGAGLIIDGLEDESLDFLELRTKSEKAGSVAIAHQRRGEILALRRDSNAIEYLQYSLELRTRVLYQDFQHYSVRKCAQSLNWTLNRLGQNAMADSVAAQIGLSADEQSRPGF